MMSAPPGSTMSAWGGPRPQRQGGRGRMTELTARLDRLVAEFARRAETVEIRSPFDPQSLPLTDNLSNAVRVTFCQ